MLLNTHIIRVVSNGLVLGFLEFGTELVQGVSVGSVFDGDVVDILEPSDVEGVSITVIKVRIATSYAGISLVSVVGIGETLTRSKEFRGQIIGGKRATN